MVVVSLIALALAAVADARLPERALHFPSERAVGNIRVQDENLVIPEVTTGFHPGYVYAESEFLSLVQGDVRIPAGRRVFLTLGGTGVVRQRCLEALQSLDPNALYSLSFMPPIYLDDGLMPSVVRLTGLRELVLSSARLTPKGWAMLAELPKLDHLYTPEGMSDAIMAQIANVQSLKILDTAPSRMTDAGLASIAKFRSVEVMHLEGNAGMSNDGLKALTQLPALRHLRLTGPFTDSAMTHLAAMPALRVLWLDTTNVTDAGLQRLSQSKSIERLCLHWLDKITDRGVAHLRNMAQLKGLDVMHASLSDVSLKLLATMPNIDYLTVPNTGFTDAGVAHLNKLTGLKYLWVNCASNSPLTDESLRVVGQLPRLEKLHISGMGFTAKGVEHLFDLKALQVLSLSAPELDDSYLKQFAKLKSLRHLSWSFHNNVTMSGLKALNEVPALEDLNAKQVRQDNSGLDLSGLKNLKDLTLGMCVQAKVGDKYIRRYDAFRDSDLACLSGLTNLEWLSLAGPGIGDDGVRHLAPLMNLEILSIEGSPNLTDNALKYLAGMRKLRSLDIYNSRITEAGLAHLYPLKGLNSVRIKTASPISRPAIARLRTELPSLQTLEISPPASPKDPATLQR
jgi:Leucine-rich repeat (LRR) protein